MGLLDKAAGKIKVSGIAPGRNSIPAGPVNMDNDAPVEAPPEYAPVRGLPGALQNAIIRYCNTFTTVHGIILAYPPNYDEGKEGEPFCEQVNRLVTAFGTAVPLSSHHILVLFSNTIDRELLAHRLSKSLETEVPVVFQADNLKIVVEYIRPFL
jgi:hypothetical protein